MGVNGSVTAYFLLNGNVTFDNINPQVSSRSNWRRLHVSGSQLPDVRCSSHSWLQVSSASVLPLQDTFLIPQGAVHTIFNTECAQVGMASLEL
jgi:hypothetical protein